jgi:DNA mismatch repair protein MutS
VQIDQTSLADLSIFNADEAQSVFHRLNYTRTDAGRYWLRQFFMHPFEQLEKIAQTQQTIRMIQQRKNEWPELITNGTNMVIEKLYETPIDDLPRHPDAASAMMYKVLHAPDYAIVKYSVGHCIDFLRGLEQTVVLFGNEPLPAVLESLLQRIAQLTDKPEVKAMQQVTQKEKLSRPEILHFGFFLKNQYKQQLYELIDLYGKLDAWYSMAVAMEKHHLYFPEFVPGEEPQLNAKDLFHLLLPAPTPYSLQLNKNSNFIFLTGANMAGKSTFIKSVGVAVYLAHLGMGVPAAHMQLSLFHGLLSNIQVSDNIVKGESYFFNEVQRIKNTIIKINNGKKWLVLIDELFKGTNVQDAMKCSSAVIQGLVKMRNSLFILSTHLYEIGEDLKQYPNIAFRYFETAVSEDQLQFSYQLKEGISNDRLGYLILKREKVVELLDSL